MSGICGIWNLDGAPSDPELLGRMTDAASYRGADGIQYRIMGPVGMAHLTLHTTPESVIERQPFTTADGNYCITADARIDNRAELIKPLLADGTLSNPACGDAELILAAYRKWGTDCAPRLTGDFAFSIWDTRRQSLFAARDLFGCRGFHYHHSARIFAWATEASQLLALPSITLEINETTVARDLALPGEGGRHGTYFRNIVRLGPGERIMLDRRRLLQDTYRDFDPSRKIHYSDEREYVDHFRELFLTAVRDRLRTRHRTAIFMSSGLDSTSVAAASRQVSGHGRETAPAILHFRYGRSPAANEHTVARAVAARLDLPFHEHWVDNAWPLYDFPNDYPLLEEPFSSPAYSFVKDTLNSLPAGKRPRVCMSGLSGDYMIGGSNPYYLRDLLARGRLPEFTHQVKRQARISGTTPRWVWYSNFVQPLYLQPARSMAGRLLGGVMGRTYPAFIDAKLARRTELADWVLRTREPYERDATHRAGGWTDPAANARYRYITRHKNVRMRVWFGNTLARLGAEYWEPWDDIRLAEFLLAIPQSRISRGVEQKNLLRDAMADLLPCEVLDRRGLRSGGPDVREDVRQASSRIIRTMLENPRCAQFGYVNSPVLRRWFDQFTFCGKYWGMPLWTAISLESWLRRFVDSSPSSL